MKRKNGSILIFVIWVLIALSLLGIAVSYNYSGNIKLAKYESDSIKAVYLAKAGIAKIKEELDRDKNDYDSLNENWSKEKEFKFGGGEIICKTWDEESRFNLNGANIKREHLVMFGLDDALSQAILDYKAKKRDKGFEFTEELFLIDGLTRVAYLKIKNYISIYRGNDPRVNINTADENMLKIVLSGDSLLANKIIIYREGDDCKAGTEDDGIFTEDNLSVVFESMGIAPDRIVHYQGLLGVKSDFFRILAAVSFSENKDMVKNIEAVLDSSGKIFYWKED